jgi:hypothetical protein
MFYVPMLTPDDPNLNHGEVPSHLFECRDFIRPFLEVLKKKPRSLERISDLGSIEPNTLPFHVDILSPNKYLGIAGKRKEYWKEFEPEKLENTLVFYDPDNGFETKTQHATKWVRHSELKHFLSLLPESSAIVVYQHRPHRAWGDVFTDIKDNLDYSQAALEAYERDLAFVAIAGNHSVGQRVFASMKIYADQHPKVKYQELK